VRVGLDALCVERQIGTHPLQAMSLDVGSRRPLGVGAGSCALMACQPASEREATIAAQEDRLAAYPDSQSRASKRSVTPRACGVTFIPDLVVAGMTGIGIAIRDGAGLVVAALSVAAAGSRLEDHRGECAAAILEEERRAEPGSLADRLGRDLPPKTAE
jgi:DNA-binding IclR family transcriptional regulator